MVKESWGKKHICPFCSALFYDMKKEELVCPKCNKNLSVNDEIEFIKNKKRAENLVKDSKLDEFNINEGIDSDLSDAEMFLDMNESAEFVPVDSDDDYN